MEEIKKENVMIVHNYYQIPGGEDSVVANEKGMLERHGHKVVLYSRSNVEIKKFSLLHKFMLPFMTIFNLKTYRDIKRLIKEEHIEIVHVHNTLNLISPSVYYASRTMGVPVIQTMHNFRLLCPGATFYRDGHICEECIRHSLWCAIKHRCYRESRMQTFVCVVNSYIHRILGIYKKLNYICLTEFNRMKLLELKQIKEEKIFVKPNFVESKEQFIAEKNRKNQFIFAGRLDKLKGIDILFEAWRKMGDTAPKLIVCGIGPMEKWCENFIRKNKVNIDLKGYVPNIEVRKLIANSRGLILPTQWYEGFPMSIVEAFSVGTPVVCSDLGNSGSIVEEGVTGCKFRWNSVEDLCRAVNRCRGMNDSTFCKYREKYIESINYEELIDIYRVVEKAKNN